MKFTLNIESSNAAMVDDPAGEVVTILRRMADMAAGILPDVYSPERAGGVVRDSNGNAVGRWEYIPEPDANEQSRA